jgi:photosystem II stability/assembly factor-like uncharacterized protein
MKRALCLLPLLALLAGCTAGTVPHVRDAGPFLVKPRPVPPPTENWLGDDAERINRKGRKAWFEEMHRTAPGVDWRAIERANGERLTEMRNELRGAQIVPRGSVGDWVERGSRNLAGRMHATALSLDGTHIYGGSAGGGVWRATLEGDDWEPLGDNLWGGAHQVAVASSPVETILAMTNWGRLRYTTDGGQTWVAPSGLPGDITGGKRLLVDAGAPSRVFYLLRRRDFRELHRSEDGGRSFQRVRAIGDMPADIWMDRLSGGRLYLLQGVDLAYSDDAGDSWQPVGRIDLPLVDDVVLAGSEAGAPTLYAAVKPDRDTPWWLYGSTDAGENFYYRHQIDDFWKTLVASTLDAGLVITGGVEVWRSEDGGGLFELVNGWGEYYGDPQNKLHADIPGMHVVRLGADEVFYISTDGGLYRSDDGLQTVRNISRDGLGISQYYCTLTSRWDPYLVIGGSQDQGYQRTSDTSEPILAYEQLISGDYGQCTSSDGSHERVITVYPGFILIQEGELDPVLERADFPPGEEHTWMPYVLADPSDPEVFWFAASHLYRYEYISATGEWGVHLASPIEFTANDGYTLSALSISRVDPDRFIVVNNAGAIWYSDDHGDSWTPSSSSGPSAQYLYGNALAHSPLDALTAYLGGSGYSGPAVYRTTDGGATWTPAATGLPSTMVYDLAFEGPGSEVLYAATESGPYRLDPSIGTWEYIGAGVAPLTTYWSVEAVPMLGAMRFGTYGRGIWDYQATIPPELCWDGIDNDGDTLADCDDAECVGLDSDGDTVDDCHDCNWRDPDAWEMPGETARLWVARSAGGGNRTVQLNWSPAPPTSGDEVFDVLTGDLLALHQGGWPAEATCRIGAWDPTDYGFLLEGTAQWILVRPQNGCGEGTLGSGAAGERAISSGDCD